VTHTATWPGRPLADIERLIEDVRANWRLKYTAPTGRIIYRKGDIILIYDGKGSGTIYRAKGSALQQYQWFIQQNPGGV